MRFMVYFKGKKDIKFMPMDIMSGELFSRLAYAPMYGESMLDAVKAWIDESKKRAPECKIQLRIPGTAKIIYQ